MSQSFTRSSLSPRQGIYKRFKVKPKKDINKADKDDTDILRVVEKAAWLKIIGL
jgi:hypothetical protein